jgi:hypothetical protein
LRPSRGARGRRRSSPRDLEGAALGADALDLRGVVLDLLDDAVELDEEDGAGALG